MRLFHDQRTARRGFALAAALGGIVVIGVLIGGVFFMSTQEVRISGGAFAQERAFRAAELGLNTTIAQWDNLAMASAGPGAVIVTEHSGNDWTTTVRATKLNETTYSLVSNAVVAPGTMREARKGTGLAVRLAFANFGPRGALTARGDTKIGGSSFVTGFDTDPESWGDCPANADALPGVAIGGGNLNETGNNVEIVGEPRVLPDAAAADTATYFQFGDLDWASLTASAAKVYDGSPTLTQLAPTSTDGSCNTGAALNWGEPLHDNPATAACRNYFPIIHARDPSGRMKISNGRGQGILLVEGDLEIGGNFEFNGPVIVRGTFKTTGTGNKITGAVMVANIHLDSENVVLGNATVRYSNCVIEKARRAAAVPQRLVHRAWVDVH